MTYLFLCLVTMLSVAQSAFLCVVFVKGAVDISLGRQASWKHVTHLSDHETALVA